MFISIVEHFLCDIAKTLLKIYPNKNFASITERF